MYRDKSVLNTFAKIAASEFTGPARTPLSEAVKKIAAQEALTPPQIQYVATEANREAWAHLFKLDKTAAYDFPLADASKIVSELGIKNNQPKINEADQDYLAPPVNTKLSSFDPFKALGIVEENVKTAEAKKEVRRLLQNRYEKVAMLKEEIERQQIMNQASIESGETSFVKQARSMIIELSLNERPNGFKKIAEFLAHSGGSIDRQKRLLQKLAYVLKHQGLVKESDLKAPEQYISQTLPAQKVNGRHPLFITIKTLLDRYDYDTDLSNRHEIVDSSLPVMKEKIRAL